MVLWNRDNTCLGTENAEMQFILKLMHLISLLDEAKLQFRIFLNIEKWVVHPSLIFSYLDTRVVQRTPAASDLADWVIWLIVLQFKTFIHIISNMWKVYSYNLSNCPPPHTDVVWAGNFHKFIFRRADFSRASVTPHLATDTLETLNKVFLYCWHKYCVIIF